MQAKPWNGLRIRAAVIAAAAMALTFACASMAQAAVIVNDPDDPGVTQDLDIESAAESHFTWPSGSASITHTIKTYGPYSRRPCLNLRTASESYVACSVKLYNRNTRTSARISMTETPDTVTYSFTSAAVGNPMAYRWNASIRDATGTIADRTTSVQSAFRPFVPPRITIEEPILDLEPDELRIVEVP